MESGETCGVSALSSPRILLRCIQATHFSRVDAERVTRKSEAYCAVRADLMTKGA